MDKIIEKLYALHLDSEAFPFGVIDKELSDREWNNHDALIKSLTEDQKKIFSACINAKEERHAKEMQTVFEYGFKIAMRLIAESLKE